MRGYRFVVQKHRIGSLINGIAFALGTCTSTKRRRKNENPLRSNQCTIAAANGEKTIEFCSAFCAEDKYRNNKPKSIVRSSAANIDGVAATVLNKFPFEV